MGNEQKKNMGIEAAPIKKLNEIFASTPEWAKPIVSKYYGRYMQAANEAKRKQAEIIESFARDARKIIEEMANDVKVEADKHGYSYAVASRKELERMAKRPEGKGPLN